MAARSLAMKEIEDVFEDLDSLLKNPEVGAELISNGVNTSLAIVAAEALKAYLAGEKARAAEDFGMVAEEISTRLQHSRKDAS
jgi:hypothetical protein